MNRASRVTFLAIGAAIGIAGVIASGFEDGPVGVGRVGYRDLLLRERPPVVLDDTDSPVVLVGLDDATTRRLGAMKRRDATADLVNRIAAGKPRAIVMDLMFSDPDPVAEGIGRALDDVLARVAPAPAAVAAAIAAVRVSVDGDARLTAAFAEAPVIAGFYSHGSIPGGVVDPGLDERLGLGEGWELDARNCESLAGAANATLNLPAHREASGRHGNVLLPADSDRLVRRYELFTRVGDRVFPSLALQAATAWLEEDASIDCGSIGLVAMNIGTWDGVPADFAGSVLVDFRGGFHEAWKNRISFVSVLDGAVPADRFRDKLVFVGASNPYDDVVPTPVDRAYPGYAIHALVARSLVTRQVLSRSPETAIAENASCVGIAVLVAGVFLLVPRLPLVLWLAAGLGLPAIGHVFSGAMLARGMLVDAFFVGLVGAVTAFACGALRYRAERARADEEGRRRENMRLALAGFFSPVVMEYALDHPELLIPARREITVLFSDIRGFTHAAEGMPPEALASLLEEYLRVMTDVVFEHEGTLDKYIGDAVMALFGAPKASVDHAIRGCRTALGMQSELLRLQEGWRRRGLPVLDIGIGVNTGEVIVGKMGSPRKMEYTCIGDDVNFASRAEGLTKSYGARIIVGQRTRELADAEFVFRDLGRVKVQGKSQPVRIHELVDGRAALGGTVPAWVTRFDAGIESFLARDWDRADEAFRAVIASRGEDGPSRSLLEWTAAFRATPPPAGWDGSLERGK